VGTALAASTQKTLIILFVETLKLMDFFVLKTFFSSKNEAFVEEDRELYELFSNILLFYT
jgi:hypothetical protein